MHARDRDRAESLGTYGLAGGARPELRGIAAIAARAAGMPSAAVGFLVGDSFVIHSSVGLTGSDLPRDQSLAAVVVESAAELVLPDARAAGLGRGVLVPGPVGAFAGVPLVGRDGLAIGALVVADRVPRPIGVEVLAVLRTLADGIVARLELRRLDAWGGRPGADPGMDPVRLRRALEDGELVPYFHPMVDLASGRTVAFEALLRWAHPELGMVAPGRFLPAVEASGLMFPVGRHVLAEALGELAALRRRSPGARQVKMAVNASPLELVHERYAAAVLDELAMQGLRPEALVVEVTETAAFVDERLAVRQLAELREAGVEIALDDYGAGHSSALRLLRLPLDAIKLDRELVCDVDTDRRARAVVRSSVAMAAELGLAVVAEGVETESQREALLALGCMLGQGWLFARPVPPAGMVDFVEDHPVPRQRSAQGRRSVILYQDGAALAGSVTAHLLPGLRAGDPVFLLATAELCAHVDRALGTTGLRDRPTLLSAERLSRTLLRGETISPSAFEVVVAAPLRRAAAAGRPVRVACEVTGLLWQQGKVAAALELARLWRDLATEVPIDLCTAYPVGLLASAEGEQLAQVPGESVLLGG